MDVVTNVVVAVAVGVVVINGAEKGLVTVVTAVTAMQVAMVNRDLVDSRVLTVQREDKVLRDVPAARVHRVPKGRRAASEPKAHKAASEPKAHRAASEPKARKAASAFRGF